MIAIINRKKKRKREKQTLEMINKYRNIGIGYMIDSIKYRFILIIMC